MKLKSLQLIVFSLVLSVSGFAQVSHSDVCFNAGTGVGLENKALKSFIAQCETETAHIEFQQVDVLPSEEAYNIEEKCSEDARVVSEEAFDATFEQCLSNEVIQFLISQGS